MPGFPDISAPVRKPAYGPRVTEAERRARRTEGSLLFFVLVVLGVGFLLVFLARTRHGLPERAVNVNTATAQQLALALEIDPQVAEMLVDRRRHHGDYLSVRAFTTEPLVRDPVARRRIAQVAERTRLDLNSAGIPELERVLGLPRAAARRVAAWRVGPPARQIASAEALVRIPLFEPGAAAPRLIVRHPAQVFWSALLRCVSIAVLFVLVPALMRRAGVRGDPFLIPFALMLSGLGVLALFSLRDPLREAAYFDHHVEGMWLGLAALLAGALIPARTSRVRWAPARSNLRRYTYVWALLAIALTAALWLFGHGPEGVRLALGFFQPVEVIKTLLMLFVAGYLADRGDALSDAMHRWRPPLLRSWLRWRGFAGWRWEDFGPLAGIYGLALALFLIVRDLGPAILLFGAFIATLYLASGRPAVLAAGIILLAAGAWTANALHVGVVPVRVDMWRAPWDNPHPNGAQLGQALWAMASGGIWGTGLGLGDPDTLPRGRDDLIFAVLGEELGLIGGMVVLALYALLVSRGFRAALHAENDFDRLLAAGLTSLLAGQAFLIVAGVTGLLPLTGITLPFVSYGNTSLAVDFFLLGLLRGISSPSGSVPVGAPAPVFRQGIGFLGTASAVALLGLVGIGRLAWVQAVRADEIAGRSVRTPDADGVRRPKINPRLLAMEQQIERGSIYDRDGRVLATSRLDEISKALEGRSEEARRRFRAGRYYPLGPAAAHLVGYLDPSVGGPVGIERDHNATLRGFARYSELVSDYRAKDLPRWLTGRAPRHGGDVVLTLDAELQAASYTILREAAAGRRDLRTGRPKNQAAVVILDPSTGETLVSVSTPSFDPNGLTSAAWRHLNADPGGESRLFDRARFGLYPPGSTLKVATAAAALEAGIEPAYDCNHVIRDLHWTFQGRAFFRRQLRDDRGDPPHNVIRMARAVEKSCNLYFARLGLRLGAPLLHEAFSSRFGLRGTPSLAVFAADLPENAFGQGTMTATPTEMARIAAAVANRGIMMEPILVRRSGAQVSAPAAMGRPLGDLNARRLWEMMRQVVRTGTAAGVFDALPVEVAGKTGTAQTDRGDRQPHSWFIGYAPYSQPRLAFACILEHGGYGKRGAAPAVRDVLAQALRRKRALE